MSRSCCSRTIAGCLLILATAAPCFAEATTARDELLRLVPSDFGFCLVVNDLRGQSARVEKTAWVQALVESPLGQAVRQAPEFKELLTYQKDLKKYVGVDWPTLRDDVLGDAVVLAYKPDAPHGSHGEQGILLLHARRPEALAALIDRVNRLQKSSGDLKKLQTRAHNGFKYTVRIEASKESFYYVSGSFFAFTSKESLLKRLLDQKRSDKRAQPPLLEHLRKAGADQALVSLWVNPRAFDGGIRQKIAEASGPEIPFWQSVGRQWQAIDALILSCSVSQGIEATFTTLVRANELPASARQFFMEPAKPSDLWKRFPDNAILRLAARLDGKAAAAAFMEFAPAETRQAMYKGFQPLAAMVGMDVEHDIAPNIGPDWGLCVVPGTSAPNLPMGIAALAVRPGTKNLALDQALYRGLEFLAGLALFDYNRRHPDEPIRLQTMRQGNVEIKYLTSAKLFPAGFQPAWALKGGYLLLTTSPDAVAQFRTASPVAVARADPRRAAQTSTAPFFRLSCKQLAKSLRACRSLAVSHIATQNGISAAEAGRGFDDVLAVIDIFDGIDITRASGASQTSVTLRITPAK